MPARPSWLHRAAFALLLCALIAAFASVQRSGDANSDASPQPATVALPPYVYRAAPPLPPPAKPQGMTSDLDELHGVDAVARAFGGGLRAADAPSLPASLRAAIDTGVLALDDAGRVQVFVDTAADPTAPAAALSAQGMDVQRINAELRIIQGLLPVAALDDAALVDGVVGVRPPDRPLRSAGAFTTQGDAILDANDMRQNFGVDGDGVRVGVVADGLEGLAAAQASGDVPSGGALNLTTCDIVPSAPGGEPANPTSPGAGSEGTAVMEIVHDIAPGAELWFGYFGYNTSTATLLDFMAAVDCLALHVDVIIDDIVFVNTGPYDGTSAVSTNASTELNSNIRPLRGYYNAAGNFALQHYQASYVDDVPPVGNSNDYHRFVSSSTTSNQGIAPNGPLNPIFVVAGGLVVIHVQWDDTWGLASRDYDVYAYRNDNGTVVDVSEDAQDGAVGDNPTELLVFQNTGESGYFDIAINRFSANADVTFDMFMPICECLQLPAGLVHEPFFNFNTASSSIPNNSDAAGGVLALGAINASEPGNNLIAHYSSQGPTNATPGNPARTKPDVTGIDAVVVSGAGGFPSPFFGTSAAAPHAAGIAALILSCRPDLQHGEPSDNPANDRTVLRNAIVNNAVDLGVAGIDNVYGGGRLDADAAAAAAGCPLSPDTDGDGCRDAQELSTDEAHGGDRDPNYAGDFFDVTGDRSIDVADAVAILGRFGLGPSAPGYDTRYDRYIPNQGQPWRTAWATGTNIGIDVGDVVVNLQSFGHSCV